MAAQYFKRQAKRASRFARSCTNGLREGRTQDRMLLGETAWNLLILDFWFLSMRFFKKGA